MFVWQKYQRKKELSESFHYHFRHSVYFSCFFPSSRAKTTIIDPFKLKQQNPIVLLFHCDVRVDLATGKVNKEVCQHPHQASNGLLTGVLCDNRSMAP